MERPNNVGHREDQSNNNGNEEIQLGSTGNQRNPWDPSWTTKDKYGRDAVILWSRRGKCSTHSESCNNAVQTTTGQLDKRQYEGSIQTSYEILTNSMNSR
ncbi:unnamed protein product [Schistosoma curassoni]|uniref:Ovule protein n=1 Tax=Schistosoma curassoni TaxID=6186 RepID=A0A183JIF5_9TREM|nr:unnamed protein product [Schistosoma curassoni]